MNISTLFENRCLKIAQKLRLSNIDPHQAETLHSDSWDPREHGKIIYFSIFVRVWLYEVLQHDPKIMHLRRYDPFRGGRSEKKFRKIYFIIFERLGFPAENADFFACKMHLSKKHVTHQNRCRSVTVAPNRKSFGQRSRGNPGSNFYFLLFFT